MATNKNNDTKAMRSLIPSICVFTLSLFVSQVTQAGYLGSGYSSNSSESFDTQRDGFRVDFGANVNSFLDLEWSYVDFGESLYDDPTFEPGDTTNLDTSDDDGRFTDVGFGSQRSSEYSGFSDLHTKGAAAGLKFKKSANNWLQFYARVSLLAWEAQTTAFEIYAPRQPEDSDGNVISGTDTSAAVNETPCGGFDYCRTPGEPGKTSWAVDFWYGYGLIMKPFSWMAIRAEYSMVTLNAVEFPKAVLEGFNTSLEIHF